MKQSQGSLFVLIGLVILIVVAFVLVRINQTPFQYEEIPELAPVEEHIEACLKSSTVRALEKLGEQGMIQPELYLSSTDSKVSFFYFRGKEYFPEREKIEAQISDYIEEDIQECVSSFSDSRFIIEPRRKPRAGVLFNGQKATVTMDFPVKVTTGGQDYTIGWFETIVKINFADIYELSRQIHRDTVENPEWIDFGWLSKQDYDIKLVRVDESTLIYEITDGSYGLEDSPYVYRFAVKYDL